jgi:hypothetical protein
LGLRHDSGSSQQLDDFVDLGRRVPVVPFGARPYVGVFPLLGPPNRITHASPDFLENVLILGVVRNVFLQLSQDTLLIYERRTAICEVKNEPILKARIGERDVNLVVACLVQGRKQRRIVVGLLNIDYAPDMVIIEILSPTTDLVLPGIAHFDRTLNDSYGRCALADNLNLDRQQLQLPLQ